MRAAVVGHVEWVRFGRVERVPEAGAIVAASDAWEEAAGGGPVAAVQLLKLAGNCTFYTALGDDDTGRRAHRELKRLGLDVQVAWRDHPQRTAFTFVDREGERTITVLGDKLRPAASDDLDLKPLEQADAVFFVAGDRALLSSARNAATLVATSRELPTLVGSGVELDALIGSGQDAGEAYEPGALDPPPKLGRAHDGRGRRHLRRGRPSPGELRRGAGARPGLGRVRLRRLVRGRFHVRSRSR